MGLTAKEFADKHAISSRKIKPWYEKGYLGSTTKDEKTGVYDIPEDTPVPYSADGRIKKIPKLWGELLDAAQSQNSVFPRMLVAPLQEADVSVIIPGKYFSSVTRKFISSKSVYSSFITFSYTTYCYNTCTIWNSYIICICFFIKYWIKFTRIY